jgi:hypothetical protein
LPVSPTSLTPSASITTNMNSNNNTNIFPQSPSLTSGSLKIIRTHRNSTFTDSNSSSNHSINNTQQGKISSTNIHSATQGVSLPFSSTGFQEAQPLNVMRSDSVSSTGSNNLTGQTSLLLQNTSSPIYLVNPSLLNTSQQQQQNQNQLFQSRKAVDTQAQNTFKADNEKEKERPVPCIPKHILKLSPSLPDMPKWDKSVLISHFNRLPPVPPSSPPPPKRGRGISALNNAAANTGASPSLSGTGGGNGNGLMLADFLNSLTTSSSSYASSSGGAGPASSSVFSSGVVKSTPSSPSQHSVPGNAIPLFTFSNV